jgi:hypothetical protein
VFLALLDGTIAAFDDTTLYGQFVKARLGDPRFHIVGDACDLTPPTLGLHRPRHAERGRFRNWRPAKV